MNWDRDKIWDLDRSWNRDWPHPMGFQSIPKFSVKLDELDATSLLKKLIIAEIMIEITNMYIDKYRLIKFKMNYHYIFTVLK